MYVVVTQQLYREYINMETDERQETFDLSDHNMITVTLEIKHKRPRHQTLKDGSNMNIFKLI